MDLNIVKGVNRDFTNNYVSSNLNCVHVIKNLILHYPIFFLESIGAIVFLVCYGPRIPKMY